MKWDQFKNKFRKDAQQEEAEVDMAAIWDAIEPEVDEVAPSADEARPADKPEDDELFMATVLPVLVIAALLIIAVLIACLLYRKRRQSKLADDAHTFVGKGVPVIFADELDDKKDADASQPLIDDVNNRKPPPPEYPRGMSPGASHRQPLLDGATTSGARRQPATSAHQPTHYA